MTCLILLLCQAGETAFLSVAAKRRKQHEPLELLHLGTFPPALPSSFLSIREIIMVGGLAPWILAWLRVLSMKLCRLSCTRWKAVTWRCLTVTKPCTSRATLASASLWASFQLTVVNFKSASWCLLGLHPQSTSSFSNTVTEAEQIFFLLKHFLICHDISMWPWGLCCSFIYDC